MFPKTTLTATTPPEKSCVTEKKDSTVLYVADNQQIEVDHEGRWRTKRATICACTVVLTILILVAGTLGAITIIWTYSGVTNVEPTREPLVFDKDPEPMLPDLKPRIKIDDGGLWPPGPMTPDLVAEDDGIDDDVDVTFDDGENPSGRVPDGNEVLIDEEDVLFTEPNPERSPVLEPSVSRSEPPFGDESSSSYSSNVERRGRTYISSSFPYDGFYMRGGVGVPPWELQKDSQTDDESPALSSGDGEGEDPYTDGEADAASGDQASSEPSSSSFSEYYVSE